MRIYLLTLLFFLVLLPDNQGQSQRLELIRAGRMYNVLKENSFWKEKEGAVIGQSKRSVLYANKYIEAGDFTISVNMSLDEINKSGASFWFFHNQFGFDSDYDDNQECNKLFTYSPVTDEISCYDNSTTFFKAGEVFTFVVRHRAEETHFLINQKLVTTIPDSLLKQPLAGTMAFRAERNTMRIYDWTLEGVFSDFPDHDYVFEQGEGGYSCFRIPAIVQTNQGSLLAFAEGRQHSCEDNGDVDIVLKRSEDNGNTWSELEIVWADSNNTCSYAAPFVDPKSGIIVLLSIWQNGQDHYTDIYAQKSLDTRRIFQQISTDNGKSWSSPKEITREVKKENWTYYGLGYTSLIQLKSGPHPGRLLLSAYHGKDGTDTSFMHLIYSDDLGASWQLGGICPTPGINETEIVELPDGTVYLLVRNDQSFDRFRKVAYSKDQGQSISEAKSSEEQLDGFICQTSLLPIANQDDHIWLLQSSPANNYVRERLVARCSKDEGQHWEEVEEIYRGYAAYSDLIQLKSGHIACLFECGNLFPHEGICFSILNWKP